MPLNIAANLSVSGTPDIDGQNPPAGAFAQAVGKPCGWRGSSRFPGMPLIVCRLRGGVAKEYQKAMLLSTMKPSGRGEEYTKSEGDIGKLSLFGGGGHQ